jgi:hypothetical protein
MIREATQKRLVASTSGHVDSYSARSGRGEKTVESRRRAWYEDIGRDNYVHGRWVAGEVYWAKFDVL